MSPKKQPEKEKPEKEKAPDDGAALAHEEEGEKALGKELDKLRDSAERLSKEAHSAALELAEEKDKYLRLMAEYDNFRKRSQKERENIYSDVRGDTLLRFLPVYDNLERAVTAAGDEAQKRGIEMILGQFRDIMASLGVTEIDAGAGEKFNPAMHEAVMHVEDEGLGEGEIAELFQKGFRLGDKVLRCSVVKVAN
ncbi:MAG: nucleotide exchange factor GrpE [Oscillospiraceae bacterium]|nr:nucleotide exchange factor GrpE [Oscillospiraceae bacterium]